MRMVILVALSVVAAIRPADAQQGATGSSVTNQASATSRVDEKTGIALALIPGGTFQMGSKDGRDFGAPPKQVTVQSFWLATTEVTVGQFRRFIEATHYRTDAETKQRSDTWITASKGKSDDSPVVQVSWNDATAFCQWAGLRLPSQAEWEFAAGGGATHQRWAGTDRVEELAQYAWYGDYSGVTARSVRGKKPNRFGLYDMSGNVWEWCGGTLKSGDRPVRGGCYRAMPQFTRVDCVNGGFQGSQDEFIGFRVASDRNDDQKRVEPQGGGYSLPAARLAQPTP